MKKILFIIYTHSLGGGAEKILTTIVNNLNPQKYDISILEYAHYDVKEEKIHDNINRCTPIVSMKGDSKIKRLFKNIQVFSYAGFLRKKKEKYDLEISFNYLIPTFLLSKDTPSIAWIHSDVDDLKIKPYYRKLQRNSFKNIDKIVAISQNTKRSLLDVFPEIDRKLEVIYNGFDIEEIRSEGMEATDVILCNPCILYVGRLEERKNPLILLEVIYQLKKEGRFIELYYLGQGEKEKDIILRADELQISNQVHLLGYHSNPYPIMKQCDALCMMSRSEGFPTVFAEGMALEVPFISTPVGGVEELSNTGKCGMVVNTVEECSEAIKKVIFDSDTNQKMKHACLSYIDHYDLKTQITNIEKLIDELV